MRETGITATARLDDDLTNAVLSCRP